MLLFVKTTTITIPNMTTAQFYIDKIKEKHEWNGAQVRVEFDIKNNVYKCSYDTIIDSQNKEVFYNE